MLGKGSKEAQSMFPTLPRRIAEIDLLTAIELVGEYVC